MCSLLTLHITFDYFIYAWLFFENFITKIGNLWKRASSSHHCSRGSNALQTFPTLQGTKQHKMLCSLIQNLGDLKDWQSFPLQFVDHPELLPRFGKRGAVSLAAETWPKSVLQFLLSFPYQVFHHICNVRRAHTMWITDRAKLCVISFLKNYQQELDKPNIF